MDLRGIVTGDLSPRRLRVLIQGLPVTSRLMRAAGTKEDREAVQWTLTDHLLAAVLDASNIANWQRANAGKKTPGRKPRPTPRPGLKDGITRYGGTKRPQEQVRALLARLRPARPPEVTDAEH